MEANKCVGILTSGGDAPGMNAAIRAVTRAAIYNGFEVKGIMRGYRGLITDEIIPFQTQNVSNIIQQGGTILKTARCEEFRTPEGRKTAYDNIVKHGITSLVVIGGDGSLTGARIFAEEYNFPIVGLPGTIDNDLYGTDTTIGYDTALNTIMQSVDKIRDTATSHERLFFIEVMGREAGFLALNGAIASGAEAAIIPEIAMEVDQLDQLIENGFRKSKNSSIVLVAESELTGGAMGLAERVKNEYPAVRCARDHPRSHPARRIAYGERPDYGQPDGRGRDQRAARGPAQRDDRHTERRARVHTVQPGDQVSETDQPSVAYDAAGAFHLAVGHYYRLS